MMQHPATLQPPPLDGVAIQLGGVTYILPPCSLATLKRHSAGIDKFAKAGGQFELSSESVDLILAVITEALARNYPAITADAVAELVGVDVMLELFQAAMDISGLMRKAKTGNTTSSSTAQEGGTLGESTGTASPPIS